MRTAHERHAISSAVARRDTPDEHPVFSAQGYLLHQLLLADLVPPPRKHRHRYHGVFAPNHRLRKAVTSLAMGNVGKRDPAATGGQAVSGHAAERCCDANQ
jgi:hypothetical protein